MRFYNLHLSGMNVFCNAKGNCRRNRIFIQKNNYQIPNVSEGFIQLNILFMNINEAKHCDIDSYLACIDCLYFIFSIVVFIFRRQGGSSFI